MDVRVLILMCCLVNILQRTTADSDEDDDSNEGAVNSMNARPKSCRRRPKYVCGSDLKTYTRCEIEQNNDISLFEIYGGKCPSQKRCRREVDVEVCFSDGNTYLLCELILQQQPEGVTVVSKGPCDSENQESEEESNEDSQPSPTSAQPSTNAPGARQTSTTNNNAATSDVPYYTDMPATMMNTDILLTSDLYEPTTVAPTTAKVCDESCVLEFNPVCGTDGVTYPSLCVLNAVACSQDQDLDLDHVGECVP